jgi:uncharacterized protein (TIGR02594 family)
MIPDYMQIAIKEIGISERDRRCRVYGYCRIIGVRGEIVPWCSAFLCWCMHEAGIEHTHSGLARSWLNWGKVITKPFPGCIVIYRRGVGWQGHVNIFLDRHAGLVRGVGGNQRRRVGVNAYPAITVLGYRYLEDIM